MQQVKKFDETFSRFCTDHDMSVTDRWQIILRLVLRSPGLFSLRDTARKLIYAASTVTAIRTAHCKTKLGPDYKKILRLSYDVIKTYDNRKSNLR